MKLFGRGRKTSLTDMITRNMGRPNRAPYVRWPAPAETYRRPIGTTAPLRPVRPHHN